MTMLVAFKLNTVEDTCFSRLVQVKVRGKILCAYHFINLICRVVCTWYMVINYNKRRVEGYSASQLRSLRLSIPNWPLY